MFLHSAACYFVDVLYAVELCYIAYCCFLSRHRVYIALYCLVLLAI